MDIQSKNDQSINDDQELAKVLAGVSSQADDQQTVTPETDNTTVPADQVTTDDVTALDATALPTPDIAMPELATPLPSTATDAGLDAIKQEALGELRPLVDKLNVPPDEKFDTYLLLLRSTDDTSLIAPAHEAAKDIPDETRRAQALLDIIKEIDFFNQPQQ